MCLQSSFYSLGQLITAFAWGMASDRFGRKYLIVMSNFFSTVSRFPLHPCWFCVCVWQAEYELGADRFGLGS